MDTQLLHLNRRLQILLIVSVLAVAPSALALPFPPPPPIPPLPMLNDPQIITPDGQNDDTARFKARLARGDILVTPGKYVIRGEVDIPTGRNIRCLSKSVLFFPEAKPSIRAFAIGNAPGSKGNTTVWGCTFRGTDFDQHDPASYANYAGGRGGYMSMFFVTGSRTTDVLFQNNTMEYSQGDSFITYSPCGILTTQRRDWRCNYGTLSPSRSGPTNVTVYHNIFIHCAAGPGVHFNGGQRLRATDNIFIDCDGDDEADANVLQLIQSYWDNNLFRHRYGQLDPLNGTITPAVHTLTGNDLIPEDSSRSWSVNNTLTGPGEMLLEPMGCAGGGGHYYSEHLQNGAVLRKGC